MKYIRTKDGRIGKVISVRDYNGSIPTFYRVQFAKDKEIYNNYELDIITKADTIEELCDEFVIKPSFSKPFLHDEDKQSLKSVKQKAIEIGCFEIFGAIWTDKGLIYVAKMNPKGELE